MAGTRSARSTSRRDAPISPPKQAPPSKVRTPRRSKRSQSREVEEPTQSRRARRGTSVASQQSQDAGASKKQKKGQQQAKNGLSVVVEIPDHQSPAPGASGSDDSYERDSTISDTTALTSHSTAELRDMNQELMLDGLTPLFHSSTSLLKILLPARGSTAQQLVEELSVPDSTVNKRLHYTLPRFSHHRHCFGSDDFINISIATRGLLMVRHIEEIGDGPWRPDDVFRFTNIASLLATFLSVPRTSSDAGKALRALNTKFPAYFSSLSSVTESLDATFKMGLELRTQLLIRVLMDHEREPNFDPDEGLKEIFHTDTLGLHLLGWDFEGLQNEGGTLPRPFETRANQRISAIRKFFSKDAQAPVDFDGLDRSFPWQMFQIHLLQWAKARSDEIGASISQEGGIDEIVFRLQEEIQNRRTAVSGEVALQVETDMAEAVTNQASKDKDGRTATFVAQDRQQPSLNVGETEQSPSGTVTAAVREAAKRYPMLNSPADIRRVKERMAALKRKQNQQVAQTSPSKQPNATTTMENGPGSVVSTLSSAQREPEAGNVDFTPVLDDDDNTRRTHPPASSNLSQASRFTGPAPMMASLAKHQKESNKENRKPTGDSVPKRLHFIDRQDGAQRISFDSQADQRTDRNPGTRKRTLPQSSGEDENDDFERDDRNVGTERRQKRARVPEPETLDPVSTRQMPTGVVEISETTDQHEDELSPVDGEVPKSRSARHTSPPADRWSGPRHSHMSSQLPSSSQMYRVVNRRAQALKAANVPRKVQTRTPWSAEEIDRLIDLIEDHGISWSRLKRIDNNVEGEPILFRRDEVALKDKARNMKVDYIKSGVTLPENFDLVALKRSQIEELHSLGCYVEGW